MYYFYNMPEKTIEIDTIAWITGDKYTYTIISEFSEISELSEFLEFLT